MMLPERSRIPNRLIATAIALMIFAVGLSQLAKPTKHWADVIGVPHYANLIPDQFGDWTAVEMGRATVVNPTQEESLMRLYTETVARTYLHKPTGRMLMLSLAYGKDQSTDTQIHTPENCYPSQGFRVEQRNDHQVLTPFGSISSVQMVTTLGNLRTEPLTYFLRVGNGIARGSKERNIARLKMAAQGYLIDGLLFRVSEITKSPDAFTLQDQFINDLLKSVGAETRKRIIGQE